LNCGVDAPLDKILARSLAIDPAERYPHVMALLADLDEWRRHADNTSRTPEHQPQSPPPDADHSAESEARPMVARALQSAPSKLEEAKQLLQRAMDIYPPYREEYKGLLKAWLSGKLM
jgi:hypothetical protein